MGHQVDRLCTYDGVDVRVQLIDPLVQCHRPAWYLSRFSHSIFYLHKIARHNIPASYVAWCDQEIILSPSYRDSAIGRDHQPLVTCPTDNIYHLLADGSLF